MQGEVYDLSMSSGATTIELADELGVDHLQVCLEIEGLEAIHGRDAIVKCVPNGSHGYVGTHDYYLTVLGMDHLRAIHAPKPAAPPVKCRRCGRILRSATSIARGMGEACAAKTAAAARTAATTVNPDQLAKATELVAEGAIVPVHRGTVYRAVSSDGRRTYTVTPWACDCPAGVHDRLCYHRVAARLLAA